MKLVMIRLTKLGLKTLKNFFKLTCNVRSNNNYTKYISYERTIRRHLKTDNIPSMISINKL